MPQPAPTPATRALVFDRRQGPASVSLPRYTLLAHPHTRGTTPLRGCYLHRTPHGRLTHPHRRHRRRHDSLSAPPPRPACSLPLAPLPPTTHGRSPAVRRCAPGAPLGFGTASRWSWRASDGRSGAGRGGWASGRSCGGRATGLLGLWWLAAWRSSSSRLVSRGCCPRSRRRI